MNKPLPPYGRSIVAMIESGQRPSCPAGTIVVALDWDIAPGWPRIVIPGDPKEFNLTFAAGLDLLVLAPPGHPRAHVEDVVRALLAAGAHIAPAIPLPSSDADDVALDRMREAA